MSENAFRKKLRKEIEKKLNKTAPGLYQMLEIYCRNSHNADCVDLLINEPKKLKEVLLKVCNSTTVAKILAKIILTPLAEIDKNLSAVELAEIFINNPLDFIKIINNIEKKNPDIKSA